MSKSNYYKKLGQQGWNYDGHTERALEDDFYDNDMKQKPSTGNKKSKEKQHGKKFDHKHKYHKVICVFKRDILGRDNRSAVLANRCSICGKLDSWDHPIKYDGKLRHNRILTYDEIMKEFKDLPVYEYD